MIEKDERDNGDNTIELLKRGRKSRKPTDNGMKYPSEEYHITTFLKLLQEIK